MIEPDNKYYIMMLDEIDTIKYPDIRMFGINLLKNVPDYFFSAPASSSGKHHPDGDLGEGGLVRHSISVKKMLDHLLVLPGYFIDWDDRQMELLRLAALFHDCMKSGTQEDYEKNHHTKFLHPVLASNFVIYNACQFEFDYEDAKFIADAIITHMGQWSTNRHGPGKLPEPVMSNQKILHLADYLASREDINMVIEKKKEEVTDTNDEGE